jgi:hypothetical protein
MRVLIPLISLVAGIGVIAGCSSIQPPPTAKILDASHSLTACEKADFMWKEKIIPTIYSDLPALTAPGVRDIFKLAQTSFTIRSLTNDSDELDVGHRKLVHAWGQRLVSDLSQVRERMAIPESMKVVLTV